MARPFLAPHRAAVAATPIAVTVPTMTTTNTQRTRTVLAVDGNSLAHRAYHAYNARNGRDALTRADGSAVWAVYGFCALLVGIIDKVAPDALIVGFDDPNGSLRRDRYADYKAQRSDKDDDLVAQLAEIPQLLTDLGVTVICPDGLEADDVVGSVAATAAAAGWNCTIATSDRDSFALVNDTTTVLRLVSGLDNAVEVTPAKLVDLVGVRPDQYVDYAALRGDSSDNLPGVKGIGEKTAAKLLGTYETVADAYADPDGIADVIGKGAATKFLAGRANWERNCDIMEILCDVPVDLDSAALNLDPARVSTMLVAAELPNLAERMASALSRSGAPAPDYGDVPVVDAAEPTDTELEAYEAAVHGQNSGPSGAAPAPHRGPVTPEPEFDPEPERVVAGIRQLRPGLAAPPASWPLTL